MVITQLKQSEQIKELQAKLQELKVTKALDNKETKHETKNFWTFVRKRSMLQTPVSTMRKIIPLLI